MDTQLDVFAAVEYANAQGVEVINFSAVFFGDGNGDGTGLINVIVDIATSSYGMVWSIRPGTLQQSTGRGSGQIRIQTSFIIFQGRTRGIAFS